ncbi:MAG: 6-bladed beta-propeller [Verrucomicrobia bacterium]|nr:6-bladed beta-propeller [Verrucomicrobiota bacterium]
MNLNLLINSLTVSLGATGLAWAIGFCVALWVTGLPAQWNRRFVLGSVMALALPPFLVTNCWIHLLGNTGVMTPWVPLSIYSPGGTVWILGLLYWPIPFLLIQSAWNRIEPAQWECDPMLNGARLVRWVLWPESRRQTGFAVLITLVLTLNNFAVPALLQTRVFAAELWVSFNTTFDYSHALVLSLPLIAGPALLLLVFRQNDRGSWPGLTGGASPERFRRQLGNFWFRSTGALSLCVFALSLGLPAAQLTSEARTWTELWPAFAAGKSAIGHSFLFAAGAATLSITLSFALWRWRFANVLWLPFLAPGILLGIGLIRLFNRPGLAFLYQGIGIVFIAFLVRYWAISLTGARHAMEHLNPDLTDDARLCGASGWNLFRHVHLPQVGPRAAALWYITYLLCLWDVETLVLIVPPGAETVSLRVFNLLHYGHNTQVNALCILLLGLAILPLLFHGLAGIWTRASAGSSHPSFTPVFSGLLGTTLLVSTGCGDSQSGNLDIQSPLFSSVRIIGSRGTGVGQFNKPRSLAIDASDNLYVVDMTGRVQKFSPDGQFLASVQMPQTDLGKPKGMCRDHDGNIIVIEPHYSRVNHLSLALETLAQWGSKGTEPGMLSLPRAAAVTSSGQIYVSEYGQVERVQRFTGDGQRAELLIGSRGTEPGQFNRPEGLGLDAGDRLYVADSCNHRIQVFDANGQFLRAYGKPGSGPGELSYPYDVQIDTSGLQFVCEFGNSRIQVFDADGHSLEILGQAGAAPGELNNPWSLALDSVGNLYVADSRNHRVQKFLRRTPLKGRSS